MSVGIPSLKFLTVMIRSLFGLTNFVLNTDDILIKGCEHPPVIISVVVSDSLLIR